MGVVHVEVSALVFFGGAAILVALAVLLVGLRSRQDTRTENMIGSGFLLGTFLTVISLASYFGYVDTYVANRYDDFERIYDLELMTDGDDIALPYGGDPENTAIVAYLSDVPGPSACLVSVTEHDTYEVVCNGEEREAR